MVLRYGSWSSPRCVRGKARRSTSWLLLPAVMREGLVRLRHLVGVVLLLHGVAATVRRIDELGREALAHRLLAAIARVHDQPTHRQGHATLGPNLDRNLVGGAADPTALDLELRLHVVERLAEDLERVLLEAIADH